MSLVKLFFRSHPSTFTQTFHILQESLDMYKILPCLGFGRLGCIRIARLPSKCFRCTSTIARRQNRLPASYYRGGTSRAIVFQRKDLPQDQKQWEDIFRGAIGSPDNNGRQLDGLGGGISSLSKICIVGPSTHPEADVDYTFAAIGVRNTDVDYSSNCGNMTSAIGPFAVDTGMAKVSKEGMTTVRIHNTNTGKLIHSTFPVIDGEAEAHGSFAIDGVSGTAARIELAFLNPSGSKTGRLLPTGNVTNVIDGIAATCIDVGNPCVFIEAESIEVEGTILPDAIDSHPTLHSKLESIRCKASVAMGISIDEASTPSSIPKIAIVSKSKSHLLLSGENIDGQTVDIVLRALSVGQPHRAVPITVAMAAAAAANLRGSIVHKNISKQRVNGDGITIGHSSGRIMIGAKFDERGHLINATVFRTARRLMDGVVYFK